jgi:hypothetical protein
MAVPPEFGFVLPLYGTHLSSGSGSLRQTLKPVLGGQPFSYYQVLKISVSILTDYLLILPETARYSRSALSSADKI